MFADYEPRRAVNIERFGKSQIGLHRLIDLRRRDVVLQPIDIEPDRTRDLIDHVFGDLTLGCHHGCMKGLVLALQPGGKRSMGCDDGWCAENRHFLVDKPQLAILIEQLLKRGLYLLAIRTAVIEELDNSHIALRISAYRGRRVIKYLTPTIFQHHCRLGVGIAAGLVLGRPQRLDQDVGILHQVVVNDRLDCLALFGRNFGGCDRAKRKSGKNCAEQSQRPQEARGATCSWILSLNKKVRGWPRLTGVHGVARIFDLLRLMMDILGSVVPG